MSINEIHVGDVGTQFRLTMKDENGAAVDVSAATTKQILFRKPDGTTLTKAASFGTTGADGVLTYTTVANDLAQDGGWEVQAYAVLPTGSWHSDRTAFVVYPNVA